MTLNDLGFKATRFFDAEYLRNGTRYKHSLNGILTGTYIRVSVWFLNGTSAQKGYLVPDLHTNDLE